MFSTPEIYLEAEIAYRRERIRSQVAARSRRRERRLRGVINRRTDVTPRRTASAFSASR